MEATTQRQKNWLTQATNSHRPRNFWRQVSADVKREAAAILNEAEAEGRDLAEGEQKHFGAVEADLAFIAAHLEKEEAKLEEERARATSSFGARPYNGASADTEAGFRNHLHFLQRAPGVSGRRYQELFAQAPPRDPLGGFSSGEEFLSVLASGLADPRLLQLRAATMTEGVPSEGGYVVPPAISAQWLDASLEDEVVRPRCRVEPMTTDSLRVSGFDISDLSGGAPFGFTAEWADENSSATAQTGKFRSILLQTKKLRIYAEASNELVQDGQSFESQLGEALVKGISWSLDEALLNSGNGAGKPLSVLNDPALVTVNKETGQLAATIVYENIINMFSRLHPASYPRAVWVANSTTIPQLLTMSIPIGTSGVFTPAVKEANGRFSLLGIELVFSEKLPAVGAKGDIILADFTQYTLGLRKEVILEKSNAPGWSRDVMSYRVNLRADGQGRWNAAQKPKNGSTRSWCVTLAART